jgi:L-methionine (R)-S-oxide reductase
MFVNIKKSSNTEENYGILLANLEYYIVKDDNLVTNLSNLSAYLNYFLDDINWVGFYLFDGEILYLGPFLHLKENHLLLMMCILSKVILVATLHQIAR